MITILSIISCYHLIIGWMLIRRYILNHLSLVEQDTRNYVGWGSFAVLIVRPISCNTTF